VLAWLLGCPQVDVFTVADSGRTEGASFTATYFAEGTPTLAPRLVVDVAFDATLMVTWFDDDGVRKVTTDALGDHHEVQLLGLLPERTYELEVTAFGERTAAQTRIAWTTDPLPADFPRVDTRVAADLNATDTLLALRSGADDTDPSAADYVAIVRGDGAVVWWADLGDVVQDVTADADGLTALVGLAEPRLVRYGWDLAQQGTWSVGGLGTRIGAARTGLLHGSVTPMSPEGWLVLQQVATEGTDLPLDYEGTATGTRTFADERGLVFLPSGDVVREEAASAFWPVDRLGWGSLDDTAGGADAWADARRIEVDADGTWLWTLRNQDAVVAVDPATGEVEWALTQPYGLPPELAARAVGGRSLPLPWHPTWASFGAPASGGRRTLLVFDSGQGGSAPPAPPVTTHPSRALAYALDEGARTAAVAYEIAPPGGPLTSAHGIVRPSPDGGVLAVWGEVGSPPAGHVVSWDPAVGVAVRHQVITGSEQGIRVRAAQAVPPIDGWASITTTDLASAPSHSGGSGG
jgi:hypothetical protein